MRCLLKKNAVESVRDARLMHRSKPSSYSITSLVRARSDGPSALAVLRLITS